ncbi:MAG: EAL domain-containing protein [Rhodocyclaceae bacterium]|nr:EAL domain-containing protein [Rhodocyclaceae bacterium]MDZ4213173.1 EAL domain-containing protein [Rhodocyclaceae bacterium]
MQTNKPAKPVAIKASAKAPAAKLSAPKRATTKKASAAPEKTPDNKPVGEGPLYYVGIGASAGGLEALRPFVANLPAHANMTYIVAQHMSPDHRSLMVELLARETQLTVLEASHNVPPQADTIYVAPPNSDVTVANGRLRISKPTNTIGPKPSVDRFFMSLAEDQEDRAIGIILSGTGSDGSHGIKAIKAAGGICIAQEPKSAKYNSMPNAAIRAGGTDLVLPPPEIAIQLLSIVQWPRAPIADDIEENPPSTIRGIVRQIATHTGMDFSNYKDATISRQIMRRMAAMQIPGLDAYGDYISTHVSELTELAGNFLICVTSFFRDPESFEAVRRVISEILKTKRPGDDIRIWIPGCATGEEVYTVAIILAEELGSNRDKYRIQLFATDINGDAVSMARAGVYPEAALNGVDSALIERYFTSQDGMYLIDKSLREMTLFARQDLVQDPPFVRLDMVSCRNLLIYFKSELQERVIKLFHYALHNNAILFLGKSESLGKLSNLFVEKDRRNKIFIKRPVASPIIGGFARMRGLGGSDNLGYVSSKTVIPPTNNEVGHERLFEIYAPPSLLMTDEGEVLEIFGDCSAFLSIRKGKADFNAFTLIKPPLRAELRAFAHRVGRTKQSAISSPIELAADGISHYYRMAVHYGGQAESENPNLLLVCFELADVKHPSPGDAAGAGIATSERISELEQEITLNRENLQTVIEELETANEELQSLNEEAQASNEELQASNEELETANEELQASNEELITVNDELGSRTLELSESNGDLTNILNSLQKGLLVVDGNLMVTRYNRIALDFFDIPAGTKPNLTSVPMLAHVPDLLNHVAHVIKKGKVDEFEFKREDNCYFMIRMTPYVDDNRKGIGGVVMTITEITEKKVAEEKLRLSASVFEYASEATVITDAHNQIISVNPAFTTITGYTPDEVIGKKPHILNSGKHPKEFFKHMWEVLLSTGVWQGEIENRRKNGDTYTEWLSINVLKDEAGNVIRHIAVFSDITDAKKAQETIERQATFDTLTGLPNRNLTMDRLKQMLSLSRRNGRMFAVMFLDLDHFKSINDALGHAAGDELLVKTAVRIRGALRDADSVGRMGGDEFIVLLSDLSSTEDIIPIANKLMAEVREPLVVAGHTLQTATSIGITVYPMDGDTPEIMLKNADSAMYEAKKNGRNTFCFFTHRMQDEANKRHWIDSELSTALQRERMHVYYQPIMRLPTMQLAGAEALLRWQHPSKGFIPPDVFIPVAEQNGMIGRLSHWVFETGIADWEHWTQESGMRLSLAFNLSAAQFVARDHIEQMLRLLSKTNLARDHQVTIEITESLKLSDNEAYVDILRQLRQCGCRIAIDDFGTGYSSLSYLKRMPIDIIKIDRSFVRDITTDPTDAAMIRAILQMASAFGMETVAEGVETPEQLAFLQEHGCNYAQGFLFSKAVPYPEFVRYAQGIKGAS